MPAPLPSLTSAATGMGVDVDALVYCGGAVVMVTSGGVRSMFATSMLAGEQFPTPSHAARTDVVCPSLCEGMMVHEPKTRAAAASWSAKPFQPLRTRLITPAVASEPFASEANLTAYLDNLLARTTSLKLIKRELEQRHFKCGWNSKNSTQLDCGQVLRITNTCEEESIIALLTKRSNDLLETTVHDFYVQYHHQCN